MNAFATAARAAALGLGLLFSVSLPPAEAAPIPTGACCNTIDGCCSPPVSLTGGGNAAACRISTEGDCNGFADQYKGDGTTCEALCAIGACCNVFDGCCPPVLEQKSRGIDAECRQSTQESCDGMFDSFQGADTNCDQICFPTTTTTMPPTGACCGPQGQCCPPPAELKERGIVLGSCRQETQEGCNGITEVYKGDGTVCETYCPIPTTTTTTTLPIGACCQPDGGCLDVTPPNCVVGTYQGDGTFCAFTECPQPTTTTTLPPETTTTTAVPETTTTLPPDVCGDANQSGEINTTDALIALKTAVGTADCPPQRCDYNGVGGINTTDALQILRVAVGLGGDPNCPE